MNVEVVCSALGSGWARCAPDGRVERHPEREDIAALSRVVADALRHGRPVALGFTCPLSVPVPTSELGLARARNVLGPRLAEMAWVLRAIRERVARFDVEYHADWHVFRGAGRGLFVWEAVGGDAAAAVRAFTAALPDPTTSNAVVAPRPFCLAGAAALWAELTTDLGVLAHPSLAIAA